MFNGINKLLSLQGETEGICRLTYNNTSNTKHDTQRKRNEKRRKNKITVLDTLLEKQSLEHYETQQNYMSTKGDSFLMFDFIAVIANLY